MTNDDIEPTTDDTEPVMSHPAASALASGAISAILLQPFDFAKTRIQVASHPKRAMTSSGVYVMPAASRSPGLLRLVLRSVQHEGPLVLWRGTVPSLYRVVPGVTLYFTTLTSLQDSFLPDGRKPAMHEAAMMAFGARCFAAICLIPMTVVKTHFESGVHTRTSVFKALQTVYRQSGVRGLYSGLGPTLLRDAPYSSLYYMFYSEMKQRVKDMTDSKDLGLTHLFLCGTVASCLSTLITQPADVLKTRRQMYPSEPQSYTYIVKDIYKNEGMEGLFRGMFPRLMRRAGMAALSWTLFDTLKQRL